MVKIVNIFEPVSDELIIDAEVAEELRARATRNIWDVKKDGVLQVIETKYIPQRVKEAQRKAVDELFAFAKGAVKSRIPLPLVHRIVDKKALFLVEAKSVEEVQDIMKLSVSHFGKQDLVVTGKYHIPEEEFMLLGLASKMGPLTKQAQERFVYLYENHYRPKGEVANE